MGVVRKTIVSELEKTIDSLKDSLVDVSCDGEKKVVGTHCWLKMVNLNPVLISSVFVLE